MQQTLLALAALLAFSVFAFSQRRADASVERRAVSAEVEAAATDLAQMVLHEVLALAWDEEDVDAVGVRQAAPASGIGRDLGETLVSSYDDIDDYDGWSQTRLVAVGEGDLPFSVRVEVGFVVDGSPDSVVTAPTLAKRVHVHVQDLLPRGSAAPAAVDLKRVVTPLGHAAARP